MTFDAAVLSNSTIIVTVVSQHPVALVSDNKGNSYAFDAAATVQGQHIGIFRAFASSAGAGFTVTAVLSGVGMVMAVAQEVPAILLLDQSNAGTFTGHGTLTITLTGRTSTTQDVYAAVGAATHLIELIYPGEWAYGPGDRGGTPWRLHGNVLRTLQDFTTEVFTVENAHFSWNNTSGPLVARTGKTSVGGTVVVRTTLCMATYVPRPVVISPTAWSLGVNEGKSANQVFTASQGTSPYTFNSVSSNTSVATITNPTSSTITVNGVAAGQVTVTTTVTDSANQTAQSFGTVTVNSPPALSISPNPWSRTPNSTATFDVTFAASNGTAPYSFASTSNNPTCVSITNPTTATPTFNPLVTGQAVITTVVTDAALDTATAIGNVFVTIDPPTTPGIPNQDPTGGLGVAPGVPSPPVPGAPWAVQSSPGPPILPAPPPETDPAEIILTFPAGGDSETQKERASRIYALFSNSLTRTRIVERTGEFELHLKTSGFEDDRSPGADDDSTQGVGVGTPWVYDTGSDIRVYVCVDSTQGAAVWREIQTDEGSGAVTGGLSGSFPG